VTSKTQKPAVMIAEFAIDPELMTPKEFLLLERGAISDKRHYVGQRISRDRGQSHNLYL